MMATNTTNSNTITNNNSTRSDFNSCLILYATQSGRAKACARRTSRILAEQATAAPAQAGDNANNNNTNTTTTTNFHVTATGYRSINDKYRGINDVISFVDAVTSRKNNKQSLLIFFVSTTGDGEVVDSMQHIWKQLLQKSLPSNLFMNIPIAIFCLGDRAYGDQFCAAGRKLAVRLLQLGAQLYCNVGYGDDGTPGGGVFADLELWLQNELLPKLRNDGKLLPQKQQSPARMMISQPVDCPYRVKILSSTSPGSSSAQNQWSEPKYESSYREFMNTLQPLTAYLYSTTKDSSNDPTSTPPPPPPSWPIRVANNTNTNESSSSSSYLLQGQVIENQRITAEDWEQNTRHVHLKVSTLLLPHDTGGGGDDDVVVVDDDNDDERATNDNSNNPNTSSSLSDQSADARRLLDQLPYRAGDVAVILPSNSAKDVQRFINVLPQKIQDIVDNELEIEYDDDNNNNSNTQEVFSSPLWPRRCTLRGWLTMCADIHTLPEREDLRALAAYCGVPSDDDEDDGNNNIDHPARQQQEKLIAMSEPSKAGALYVDYILRQKRAWADVLYDFDSLHSPESALTVEALLTLLAPIRPREFSIASSPTKQVHFLPAGASGKDGKKSFGLELCVAVVEGKTPLGRSFHGLCSTYISQLNPNNVVRMWIRPGSFHGLPLDLIDGADIINDGHHFKAPVLYIAAGTGIAPIRGLIQERENNLQLRMVNKLVEEEEESNSNNGELVDLDRDNVLFFGCRKEKSDFYYENEWVSLATLGRLGVRTAFSRDQWHKIYVQKVLEKADEDSRLIARHVLEKNGAIYIAGGPKMAKAVKEVIVESLAKEMGGNEKGAKQLLTKLQRLGLYSVEAWS